MRHKFKLIVALLLLSGISSVYAKDDIKLHFHKNGLFKVAQFTDIHWDNSHKNTCDKTRATILSVLQAEKPDVAILTGDIVWHHQSRAGWQAIASLFDQNHIPWAVTMGNHDSEADLGRPEIFELLQNSPYFIGKKGPELFGAGNYDIPILVHQGIEAAAVLYCLDSNDYPSNYKMGEYNWIQYSQIGWFRRCNQEYTELNKTSRVPSLLFFHIPLPEFKDVASSTDKVGTQKEAISCPEFNSGLFCSLIEQQNVMGVFVGHDHDNDFIGINHGIALGFGRESGWDGYGSLERGARIIQLHEGKFKFDTWIRTPKGTELTYYYPSGLTEKEEQSSVYSPASDVFPQHQGIDYSYYEGHFKTTDEISKAKVVKAGYLKNVSLDPAKSDDYMAFQYNAWLKIPEKGVYKFYTYSDDGSELFIDGKLVVNNWGSHSALFANGKIALDQGYHDFKLFYKQNYMGKALEVGISSKDIPETKIPDRMFFEKQ